MEKEKRVYIVKLNDAHVPFHDRRAIRVALNFVRYLQPDIVLLDELIDFYTISKYSKDPKRRGTLQRDINTTKALLQKIREAVPNAKIYMLKSNHDARLQAYLRGSAPELESLDCLQFEELLELKKFGIKYVEFFMFRGVLFKHGGIVKKHSGETAKAEFEKENVSGGSGHTHRLGQFYRTQRGGKYTWIETGCLCRTHGVEYIEGTPNWQQGIGLGIFKQSGPHFELKAVPIIGCEIMWGARTFGCSEKK
jgi:hypothetical protein